MDCVEECLHLSELAAEKRGVGGVCGYAHEASEADGGEVAPFGVAEETEAFGWCEAEFGLFLGYVDL